MILIQQAGDIPKVHARLNKSSCNIATNLKQCPQLRIALFHPKKSTIFIPTFKMFRMFMLTCSTSTPLFRIIHDYK